MLFKPTVIIFVQRGGLLVTSRRSKATRLSFPDDVVHNLEVLQRDKLVASCQHVFDNANLRGKRAIVVLDYSVVFEKAIALDQTGQPDKLLEGFVAAMPFDEGQRACLGVENKDQLQLYATNADLYQAIEAALHVSGIGSVVAITPIAAYGLSPDSRTVSAAAERIFKDTAIVRQANFRSVVPA